MDASTGAAVDGDAWLAQAAGDILLTPIGTRTMRRDYGSLLPTLIDRPLDAGLSLQIYAATAGALRRWLPEFALTRCELVHREGGRASLVLDGRRADAPAPNSLTRLELPLPRLN